MAIATTLQPPDRAVALQDGRHLPARIHIVGGSGTGKTTLAAKLGRLLDLPVYHLDQVATTSEAHADVVEVAETMAARPAWIAEGVLLTWSAPFCEAAELIVWLDWGSPASDLRRVTKRFVTTSVAETRRRGIRGAFRFRSYARHGWQFVRHIREVRSYHGTPPPSHRQIFTREATAAYLEHWSDRSVRCGCPADVDSLLQCLIARGEPKRSAAQAEDGIRQP
jgi:hypothetical protein